MVIWKFPLTGLDCSRSMPNGAEILSVQAQNGELMLWAKCDPTKPGELRRFRMLMTGEHTDEVLGQFLGTVQVADGRLLLHVFEVPA
jgi:hypothetical protein